MLSSTLAARSQHRSYLPLFRCALYLSNPRWPLAVRRVCARVYHIGGLHSGFAVSGVIWLIVFTVQATKQLLKHDKVCLL
jgi:hypothetical protein